MINQITCNSNNAIELSRGQLLLWLNGVLKLSITKIEQLGSGAVYCQLLDMIYPGKVPLIKVNWKAKFDYQYVANFKILQQSFTKLNVLKHIDVEKLVKCKYQDNLEFLQWFKKIFDNTGTSAQLYDPITRRGEKIEKQNKQPQLIIENSHSSSISSYETFKNINQRNTNLDAQEIDQFHDKQNQNQELSSGKKVMEKGERTLESGLKLSKYGTFGGRCDERLMQICQQTQNDQKQYYLRKIKEIEYLMQKWDCERSSTQLIGDIRKIILAVPETNWSVEDGQFKQIMASDDTNQDVNE